MTQIENQIQKQYLTIIGIPKVNANAILNHKPISFDCFLDSCDFFNTLDRS